nr:adipokinetic hormone III [Locusta migratoria]
ELNFTPWW